MSKVKIEDAYPFPLTPKRGPLCKGDMKRALLVKPMEKLPGFLVPLNNRRAKLSFPRFYFGWALDDPNILLDIAKRNGVVPRKREPIEWPKKGDDEYDSDMEYDDSDLTFSMTDIWLKEDALASVVKELDLDHSACLVEVFNQEKGIVYMVAILESITIGYCSASRTDAQKLKDYFKFQGGPMWYLDACHWTWGL